MAPRAAHHLTHDTMLGGSERSRRALGTSERPTAERSRQDLEGSSLHDIGQFLPSYWLVQAGRISLHGQGWGVMAWAVVAAWTVVLSVLAAGAYLRDTGRV